MKDPWFEIIEIVNDHGLYLEEITLEVARDHQLPFQLVRYGHTRAAQVARFDIFRKIREERPDLTSGIVGRWFNIDSSTVRRHLLRVTPRAAA